MDAQWWRDAEEKEAAAALKISNQKLLTENAALRRELAESVARVRQLEAALAKVIAEISRIQAQAAQRGQE